MSQYGLTLSMHSETIAQGVALARQQVPTLIALLEHVSPTGLAPYAAGNYADITTTWRGPYRFNHFAWRTGIQVPIAPMNFRRDNKQPERYDNGK